MSETNYRESLCVSAVLSGVSVRLSVHSLLYKLVSKQLKAIFSAFCRLIVFFLFWRYTNPRVRNPSAGRYVFTGDGGNLRFSTEISVYPGNSTR